MITSLCYPYGESNAKGRIKQFPEDFRVDESLGFEPTGEGEHLWLNLRKTGQTTQELIEQLARDFNIKARDIGYSGLKDKQAVTSQWVSLHLAGQMHSVTMPEDTSYEILSQAWHLKKLKSGTHKSNSFDVLIRDVEGFDNNTEQKIESLKQYGMANYFGQQRFGMRDDNVSQALQIFANARKTRKLSRNRKGIYLSSLRSALFNQILNARIVKKIWQEPVEGDVFMLSGSHSMFQERLSNEILERYAGFDLSSTASLFGQGEARLNAKAAEIELEIIEQNIEIANCLLAQKINRQMRSVRIQVKQLEVDYQANENTLRVRAELPRGSYFTTLLCHFLNLA